MVHQALPGQGKMGPGNNGPVLGHEGIPQLPPQMFTTAAQLLDLTDKKLVIVLRDGRKLFGMLRSWDQFANLVLQSTTERLFLPPATPSHPGLFADIPRGTFLVRGENVLLLGELDTDTLEEGPDGVSLEAAPRGYERAAYEVVAEGYKRVKEAEKKREGRKNGLLAELGFEGEMGAEGM